MARIQTSKVHRQPICPCGFGLVEWDAAEDGDWRSIVIGRNVSGVDPSPGRCRRANLQPLNVPSVPSH